ncbi:RNB domain-containing ribonuclease [Sphingomonas sp.]|uniref:RNB domain-containing ribonuclease n=1 Tax=Sphingomonas sp. TaxID=28214 RepID=UPI003CC58AE1
MKTLLDSPAALGPGLAQLRAEFQVPAAFPPAVIAAADAAVQRVPDEHVDRTDLPFVTLDPAASTDLDQAFTIEALGASGGADLLLRYAIADVAWFVRDGDPLDVEAWARGETLYLPDGKAPLYPPQLSEAAASLLPGGPRPAVVFAVRVAPDGTATLDGVERALIRSRAKLAYETVADADLPAGFVDFAARVTAAEDRRGAARVDPPEQEVARTADGGYTLAFRPLLPAEDRNAALSLATNLAVAQALQAHGTGLFRVMAAPDNRAVARLRHSAAALGLDWSPAQSLADFQRGLRGDVPREAAFMVAIRRAGQGAGYAPYRPGVIPWHAAVAATYCHATAPLRRLADRYVVQAALAVASGRAVPDGVTAAFERLPAVMARADALASRVTRAVVDLAEAVVLAPAAGQTFAATVTDVDDHGARIQLADPAVVARVPDKGVVPGASVTVRLTDADPIRRQVTFALI